MGHPMPTPFGELPGQVPQTAVVVTHLRIDASRGNATRVTTEEGQLVVEKKRPRALAVIEHVSQVDGVILLRAAVELLEQRMVRKHRIACEALQPALPLDGMAGSAS